VASEDGEVLTWDYSGLIVDRDVQLSLPRHLSFSQRIAGLQDDFRALVGLAPFLVVVFLASLAAVLHLSRVSLGLETYLLAGCAMALFYPLLIFLSGLADLAPAAIVSLLVVSGLLMVFLGLAAGWHRIRWRVGVLLIVFLGFFSLGILTPWQGLMLTSGGLLLVGTLMLLYARRPPAPEPEPPPPAPAVSEPEPVTISEEASLERAPDQMQEERTSGSDEQTTNGVHAVPMALYCPLCARAQADDHRFCPGCGYDTQRLSRCAACGVRQFVPEELSPAYCVHCGESLA
jgi:hypothetical protein